VISGGENISTVEVEQALMSHPCVLEAAVVGVPRRQVGRAPEGVRGAAGRHQREPAGADRACTYQDRRLQGTRAIDSTIELPKTSTGKIQKFILRDKEWAGHGQRVKG
jgi:fatty-acyl-CoA synthase